MLTIQPLTGTLAAGTYNAVVSVSSTVAGNSPQDVAVTFVVALPPEIALSATTATFNAIAGSADPAAQAVTITNSGGSALDGLSAPPSYATGQPTGWLTATLGSTTAPATLTLQPTTGALAAGTYDAIVDVTAAVAANSPQTIAATFVVAPLLPPSAPSGLKAAAGKGRIDLTWKDNSSNETSFVVERSLISIGLWADIATLSANTTSYRDSNVSKGVTYFYRVFACNASGCTVSNVVSGKL